MSKSLSAIFIISSADRVVSEFTEWEVITSHSEKIGWRPTDWERGEVCTNQHLGVVWRQLGAARRTRVEMYEIKIGQTRKFLITVSPQKELLWKVKCQQPLWVPESNGDTGGDWEYVTLWHIHIMPALWYKLNLNGKSLSDSNLAFLSILFIQYIILGNGSSNHLEFTYNLLVSCHVFRHFIHKTT